MRGKKKGERWDEGRGERETDGMKGGKRETDGMKGRKERETDGMRGKEQETDGMRGGARTGERWDEGE